MRKRFPELFGVSLALMLAVLVASAPLGAKPKKKEELPAPAAPVQELPHIGPEIKGPAVVELPVKISCIPHQGLASLVENVKLKLVFYSVPDNKGVIKLVYAKEDGILLIVMLNKDHACFVFDMAETQAHDGTFFKRLGPGEKG